MLNKYRGSLETYGDKRSRGSGRKRRASQVFAKGPELVEEAPSSRLCQLLTCALPLLPLVESNPAVFRKPGPSHQVGSSALMLCFLC